MLATQPRRLLALLILDAAQALCPASEPWSLLINHLAKTLPVKLCHYYSLFLSIRITNDNNVKEAPQLPQWISLTTPSPSPTVPATSPAATQTTPLRWRLAAREPAALGNAQQLGPLSAHPGIVRTIPQLVILSSMTKLLRIKEEKGHLQLCQGLIWHGAPAMVAE